MNNINKNIKLIASDLDFTLLDINKKISERNMRALRRISNAGIIFVPASGRFYNGLPKCVRELDFVRYVICCNGAYVYDVRNDIVIYRAEIPKELALKIISMAEKYPVAFDCYIDNQAYMNDSFVHDAEKYAPDDYYLFSFKNLRRKVSDLKEFVNNSKHDIQKIQWFFENPDNQEKYIRIVRAKFPDVVVSSAVSRNIEINIKRANKGEALEKLCGYLKIPVDMTAAFGDNLNDITMIQRSGIGVAMGNASESIQKAADIITLPFDQDGFAYGVEKIIGIA